MWRKYKMKIKEDPFVMVCIWMSQFPCFYLKSYLACKDIRANLLALRMMGRISFVQAMSVLDYAKENNLS